MEELKGFEPYKILKVGAEVEIVEKKSRFLATIEVVESEEDVVQMQERIRKKYWDARHHCYAYVIGRKAQLTRSGDDGEPSKTAGPPILEVLLGEEVRNAMIIVSRYFGGVLLGTGGLVRAYGRAAKEGLAASQIVTMTYGMRAEIVTEYTLLGKIQFILAVNGLALEKEEYTEVVRLQFLIPEVTCVKVSKEISEVTAGKVELCMLEELYFEHI